MKQLNGVDCVTEICQTLAEGLKENGIEYVGRYLGNSWKSIKEKECDALINAGLKIISIWETNPTFAAYFTKNQGSADAKMASAFARSIGQIEGSAIYFAVDFDAQDGDMKGILNYFSGIREELDQIYKAGVYGSYDVLKMLHNNSAADYYWQTGAWSRGKVASFIDILQFNYNQPLLGIQVDYNEFFNGAGSWGKIRQQPPTNQIRQQTSTYIVQPGDTLSGIAARFETPSNELVKINNIKDPNLIYAGQTLNISGAGSNEQMSYMIKPGDTLSQIAKDFKTTVTQLQAWNQISNPNLIRAGQRIRVK
jgi:LysM repeat protein